jgi:V/A-type H+-transporting ATPase subunit I
MRKFLFIGFREDREAFFRNAQKAGVLEFTSQAGKKGEAPARAPEHFSQAIKILRSHELGEQEIRHDMKLAESKAHAILDAKAAFDEAQAEIKKLSLELSIAAPFGDFSFEAAAPIEQSTKRILRFYSARSAKHFEDFDPELIRVSSENSLDYFIAFTVSPLQHPDLVEIHIDHPAGRLREELRAFQAIANEKEEFIKSQTKYDWLMHWALIQELNAEHLHSAVDAAPLALDSNLFVTEGWIPTSRFSELQKVVADINIVAQEVVIEEHDKVPTYLENQGSGLVGEDLINIFDVPSARDKDPSTWVLFAFSLFFAMIVGDAGYGFVFLIIALMMKFKIKNIKGATKHFMTLIAILGTVSVLWGLAINSFFGISLSPDNPLKKYSPLNLIVEREAQYHMDAKDETYQFWVQKIPALADAKTGEEFITIGSQAKVLEHPGEKFQNYILFELALMTGAIHIILGLARYLGKNPVGAGWIAFIVGGYLYLPYYLDTTSIIHYLFGLPVAKSAEFGLQLLTGGLCFVAITGMTIHGVKGIFEIVTAVQIFADILSYLRIYALGLAGSILAGIIADMASGLPLFFAALLMIFAHALNMVVAIMGGVIHGLRLNFLEWFHYSFLGGGSKFKPLELQVLE